MPNPTPGDVHVSVPLTNISTAWFQDQRKYIADRLFPIVQVQKQADRYYQYSKDEWFRTAARRRAPATESAGSGYTLDATPTYYCEKYALHKDVDDDTRVNADPQVNVDADATRFVAHGLSLLREKDLIDAYFRTGVWTTEKTGVTTTPSAGEFRRWDDYANSDPIQNVRAWKRDMEELTGYTANKLVIGPRVLDALVDHPDFLDRVKYTERGIINLDLLAALFDVPEILVPAAIQNTAKEGQAGTYSFLYGKYALLAYSTPTPSLLEPTAGYTFAWTGLLNAGAFGNRIKRFRLEQLEADRVEGELAYDMKVVSADLGLFAQTVVS